MKLLQETGDATKERKIIKSQVEKRRRERMNSSLERLRTMLLQEPQQLGRTQHRMEKAEILEHSVFFLQNTAERGKTRAAAGGGDQKHSFQDGFSTCLQTAAQFLGPEGKGLWLGASLDASLATRFSRLDSDSAGVQRTSEARSFTSLPHTKSILRMLRKKSKHRLHTRDCSVAHPYRLPVQQRFPQQAQRQNQLETRVESQAGKQSPSQSSPVSHTLWRPCIHENPNIKTTIMKLLQDSEDAKAERKSLKPQVERRRRERMNRSLESLKTLLLQQQEATQRRVEKAEILEHTVLFLQNTYEGDKTRVGVGGVSQKQSYQDGFSTCLQRASRFLGHEGKGLWLGAALDASLAARFSSLDSDSAGVQRRTEARSSSSSLLLRKSSTSILRLLIHRSGHRLRTAAPTVTSCVQTLGESHRSPTAPQQPHKVASRASKQSPSQSMTASQSLWRPWP
ncbi:uncharacterized protein LOC115021007 [Cottoperca gobio]|uniref:Uncharacterized protein LOC115021007 n=1 Tax=Cottoperca gobio TaxID=56716 RepID=A0A6J2R9L9_COTGO|nr:uncharacterized protein LOC115021007 [Cottoperca gobio]